ncbi:MAG: hypothetical protein KJS97_13735 [Alphaproteobacteria bacterium]|nr:hypothetical protein [Alphaproteobacteria bacterium]
MTGHRLNQLPEDSREALQATISAALFALGDVAHDIGRDRPRPELYTALAEGADRYAAHAALALGWRVAAASPFGLSRYMQDFPDPAATREFRDLWAAAQSHVILRDGAAPYAAIGRWVAARSDVLLAVWNGAPPNGPGGTAEVCALAAGAGKPIVWLTPDGAAPRLVADASDPHPGSARQRLHKALRGRFEAVARPAEMRRAG